MKLLTFSSGERPRALWALLFLLLAVFRFAVCVVECSSIISLSIQTSFFKLLLKEDIQKQWKQSRLTPYQNVPTPLHRNGTFQQAPVDMVPPLHHLM